MGRNHSHGVVFSIIPAQVGIPEAEQVLCSGEMPIARLITVGLGVISMYFIFKFLVQLQFGLDTAGKVPSGRDPMVNLMKKNRYKMLRMREALYSLLAGLLPSLLLLVVFPVLNINVVDCLA